MTTLVIAHKRIKSLLPRIKLSLADEWFLGINRKGILTFALLSIGIVSAIAYLLSLYFAFQLGFQIRDGNVKLAKLENNAMATELELQKAEARLVKDKNMFFSSMQEISSIKYITTDAPSVSLR